MATSYAASPFVLSGIQSYIVKGIEVDETGRVDAIGTSGSINVIHKTGGTGANFVLIWDGMAATTGEADIVIPVTSGGSGSDSVIYIDKGITCSTAVTLAVSSVGQGGAAPSGTNVNVSLFIT